SARCGAGRAGGWGWRRWRAGGGVGVRAGGSGGGGGGVTRHRTALGTRPARRGDGASGRGGVQSIAAERGPRSARVESGNRAELSPTVRGPLADLAGGRATLSWRTRVVRARARTAAQD